jgi:hypothetical protein
MLDGGALPESAKAIGTVGSTGSSSNSRTRSVAPTAFWTWLTISAKLLTAPPTKVV